MSSLRTTPTVQAIYQLHRNLRDDAENNTGNDFIANFKKQSECDGHYIKLTVDPSGESYTFSIPATGHKKSFATRNK